MLCSELAPLQLLLCHVPGHKNQYLMLRKSLTSWKDAPHEFTMHIIPAATWVVFKTSGPQPESLLKTWERIYAEWLPSSGYDLLSRSNLI
ncbi:GyrI-like domain-containing protein [Paenibacillus sp. NPDC056579]|uniref:GyrI-like domain-containing protein n=1 Tax=Paenibacillus sp. NPDC056579 TaxID=3345871 RepID=UPI0036757E68